MSNHYKPPLLTTINHCKPHDCPLLTTMNPNETHHLSTNQPGSIGSQRNSAGSAALGPSSPRKRPRQWSNSAAAVRAVRGSRNIQIGDQTGNYREPQKTQKR